MEKSKGEEVKDALIASDACEVVREKLEGHKAAINSLDFFRPQSVGEGYLNSNPLYSVNGLLLSASDDGTSAVWDLRLNKRVLLIQDKETSGGVEVVKAKFV